MAATKGQLEAYSTSGSSLSGDLHLEPSKFALCALEGILFAFNKEKKMETRNQKQALRLLEKAVHALIESGLTDHAISWIDSNWPDKYLPHGIAEALWQEVQHGSACLTLQLVQRSENEDEIEMKDPQTIIEELL